MNPMHSSPFPGETPEYRRARDELLTAEMDLRRQIESVAALRRELPAGGESVDFDEIVVDAKGTEHARTVHLSDLFAEGQNTLLVYSYMYGPAMATPGTSSTSILDGLDGTTRHVRQRVSFAVVARSPIERVRQVARERGWRNLRLLSSARNTYNHDYHGESADGDQLPMMTVFVRRDGTVRIGSRHLMEPEAHIWRDDAQPREGRGWLGARSARR